LADKSELEADVPAEDERADEAEDVRLGAPDARTVVLIEIGDVMIDAGIDDDDVVNVSLDGLEIIDIKMGAGLWADGVLAVGAADAVDTPFGGYGHQLMEDVVGLASWRRCNGKGTKT
jgi:hypothetical protein